MDTTYRFRFLIYLAAFMLIMSVCFAYAESIPTVGVAGQAAMHVALPSSNATPKESSQSSVTLGMLQPRNPLLFQSAPQHSGFLTPSAGQPDFDPAALHAAAPVVSQQQLELLESATHSRLAFLHRAHHSRLRAMPAPANDQREASWLGMTAKPDTAR